MERKFGVSVDLIEEITKLTKERILSNIVFILAGIIIYFYLSTKNNLTEIEHLSQIAQDNLRYILYVMLEILAPTIIIFMYINKNHPKTHAKLKSNFICLLRDINILINQFKIFTIIGLTVLTLVMRHNTSLLCSNLLSIIVVVFVFIILNALINLIIQGILGSNQLQKIDDMKYKCVHINYLKQNWITAFISGLVGCVITLFAIFALHVKTWDSNAWSAAFNFFMALSSIAVAMLALIAYQNYWKQKKESTIYDRIINGTSLVHSEILQLKNYIDNYAFHIVTSLNVATPENISVDTLKNLLSQSNDCIEYIDVHHKNIATWQAEFEYIVNA